MIRREFVFLPTLLNLNASIVNHVIIHGLVAKGAIASAGSPTTNFATKLAWRERPTIRSGVIRQRPLGALGSVIKPEAAAVIMQSESTRLDSPRFVRSTKDTRASVPACPIESEIIQQAIWFYLRFCLTVRQAAVLALVSHETIIGIESDRSSVKQSTIDKVQAALEKAGVEFDDDGLNIRIKPTKPKGKRQ